MSAYEMVKIFDLMHPVRAPQDVFETACTEQANDSYARWTVGHEYNGCGANEEERAAVDKWLIENGAEEGELVLLSICW